MRGLLRPRGGRRAGRARGGGLRPQRPRGVLRHAGELPGPCLGPRAGLGQQGVPRGGRRPHHAVGGAGQAVPVDSEHSAIFQCFLGEDPWRARRIWLAASGGPFFGRTREELAEVTAADALRHPNWSMGPKVTTDSSTLMNKGLEAIEAHPPVDAPFSIGSRIVVQRQSAVHSMVEYDDGSVLGHLGAADMRVPIQYALSFPDRWPAPCPPLDFPRLGHVDFAAFATPRPSAASGSPGGGGARRHPTVRAQRRRRGGGGGVLTGPSHIWASSASWARPSPPLGPSRWSRSTSSPRSTTRPVPVPGRPCAAC